MRRRWLGDESQLRLRKATGLEVPRAFRPGLQISTTEARPIYGSQDIWLGTAKAYIKFPDDPPSRLLVHEFLAARLANALGVPVPFGEIAVGPNGLQAWATAHIGFEGQDYAPPSISEVLASEGEMLAGIGVFDTWIYNPDRTDENIIWHPSVGLWAIDHESSFCGHVDDGQQVLRNMKKSVPTLRIFEHVAPSVEQVLPWLTRIGQHGKDIARRCTDEAWRRGLITRAEGEAYRVFLSDRARNLSALATTALHLPTDPVAAALLAPGHGTEVNVDLFTREEESPDDLDPEEVQDGPS